MVEKWKDSRSDYLINERWAERPPEIEAVLVSFDEANMAEHIAKVISFVGWIQEINPDMLRYDLQLDYEQTVSILRTLLSLEDY